MTYWENHKYILKMGGGGGNKMEGQRWMFAFTHKFTTEDPMIFWCDSKFEFDVLILS